MILSAQWLLPIDRPAIKGGWIEIEAGRIAAIGEGRAPAPAHDLGNVVVMPGLVNAHTHVELSALAGKVPPAGSLVVWIRALLAARAAGSEAPDSHRHAAMSEAVRVMHDTGTVLVGDISNTLTSLAPLEACGIGGVVFHELIGFAAPDPTAVVREGQARLERALELRPHAHRPSHLTFASAPLETSLCAHAPYSVSPGLLSHIARHHAGGPLAIHLAESKEELEFLRTGRGPFRDLLEDLGAWNPAWTPPACGPVEYLRRVNYLQPGLLAAHGVQLNDDGLAELRDAGATVVACPRSNVWVGAGIPRVTHFYAAGVPVAVGTDSLASVGSLNLFDELAELRRVAPDVAAASLLDSGTRVGALALGYGATHGTLTPGKHAALVGVDIPPDVNDVEEYLVSGVPPSAIRRVA
jgi:aminodeoxyfutalosine deaminase